MFVPNSDSRNTRAQRTAGEEISPRPGLSALLPKREDADVQNDGEVEKDYDCRGQSCYPQARNNGRESPSGRPRPGCMSRDTRGPPAGRKGMGAQRASSTSPGAARSFPRLQLPESTAQAVSNRNRAGPSRPVSIGLPHEVACSAGLCTPGSFAALAQHVGRGQPRR